MCIRDSSSSGHCTGISKLTQYRVATSYDLTGKVSAVMALSLIHIWQY